MSRYADYVRCEFNSRSVLYFPKQHANKVMRKNKLVNDAMDLREQGRNAEAALLVGKIMRLNRSIPQCGISEAMYMQG